MKINALGYLGYQSPNHKAWRTFGPETLALGLGEDGKDGAVRLRMDERHHRISIHPGETEEIRYLGWELADRIAFEGALKELDQKKVAYKLATADELDDRRVVGMAWMLDPYGYRHELYYGQQFIYGSFMPGRPINGFFLGENGNLGIGHHVLVVPEVTKAGVDFAVNVLGFRTYWPTMGIEFYRCNARSHCLAYVPVKGMRGPHHFYIDTKSMDDVGRAYDRCKEQNCVVLELGRLTQDDDVSFYLRTPSGVDIQYATGGRLFKDEEAWVNPGMMGDPRVWGHKVLLPHLGPGVRSIGDGTASTQAASDGMFKQKSAAE